MRIYATWKRMMRCDPNGLQTTPLFFFCPYLPWHYALRLTLSNHVAHFQFSPAVLKRAINSNRMYHNGILSRIGHSIILRSRCIKITKNDEGQSRSSICDTFNLHGVCRYGCHQFCNCSWVSSKG